MTGVRILSVDWHLDHPTVRRGTFFDSSSFSAYEVVFVDPERISGHWTTDVAVQADGVRRTDPSRDRGFGRTLVDWMSKRRSETEDLLVRGGGLVVCQLRPRGAALEVGSAGAPTERVDRYTWLPSVSLVDRHHQLTFPSNSRFLARRGTDVVPESSDSPFADYIEAFVDRIAYTAVYQDLLSTPIERFATVLARNRVGDIIALEIPFDDGRLVLLPPVQDVPVLRETEVLLECVKRATDRPGFVSMPDWLPAYVVDGEEELADELAGLVERRDTLNAKIDEVQAKLEDKTRYKKALYAKGRAYLRPAIAAAFRALGFDVDEQVDTLRLTSNEGDALVAFSATETSTVGLPPYRKLLTAVDRAVTDGDGHHKGILIVSGSRELDPKRRPTQYSDDVLRGCQAHGFCLVTTYQLFKLVRKALQAKDKRSLPPLRRAVLETDGSFRDADAS